MTVIQFPVKEEIKLTEDQEKRIDQFAKAYIILLNDLCDETLGADYTDEQTAEVFNLILGKLLDSFTEALEELET